MMFTISRAETKCRTSCFFRATGQIADKFLHGRAERGLFVSGIHAVAVQFDKDPIRSAFYRNRGLFPQSQSMEACRIRLRQSCIVDSQ